MPDENDKGTGQRPPVSGAAKERFKRGQQAARKGNLEYAVELYMQGLSLDPRAAEERQTLHNIERRLIEEGGGNPQGGMKAKFKTAPLLAKIKKLSMQKKWDEAVLEYEKALRPQPQNPSLLLGLAGALENLDSCMDAAIGTLEEVVSVDKTNVEAYRKLGQLCTAQGDVDAAVEHWEKLRMYKPDDKEAAKAIRDLSAANLVQRAEERQQQTGDESFRSLLKDEEESEDLEKKSKVIRTDEDRLQAIEFKKEELKKEPKNSRLWRELGGFYQDLKKWNHARKAYETALKVNPHDLFAHDKIGALREQQQDEKLSTLREKVDAVRQRGANAQDLERLEKELQAKEVEVLKFKIEEYERRTKAHPTDYQLKVRFGEFLMQGGRHDKAIAEFQKAVKDPKFKIGAQNLMGKCFQAKGVLPIAISQFEEALRGVADPDSPMAKEIKYNLAIAYEENGQPDKALSYYQQIMAADIGYRDVSSRVDQLMKRHGGDP